MRQVKADVGSENQLFEEGGASTAQRDEQLYELAAFDTRCAARQRELHLLPVIQSLKE